MFKFFLACLIILIFNSPSKSQTYIYDKNLKAPDELVLEVIFTTKFKTFTPYQIIEEFKSNSIRADYLFNNKTAVIIKGKINSIFKYKNVNWITFDVSENDTDKKQIYVFIQNTKIYESKHTFDKITNYSVGDYVYIVSMYGGLSNIGHRVFGGNILHKNWIENPKKNFFVKINNVPDDITISYENEGTLYADKFSKVLNGKSFCKLFNIYRLTNLNLTFKNSDGDIVKNVKIVVKMNCHSIFDYNKL